MYAYSIVKDEIIIIEKSKEELEAEGKTAYETSAKAMAKGRNERFKKLKQEWDQLSDYTSERALAIERLMYGDLSSYTDEYRDGMYTLRKLEEELKTLSEESDRAHLIKQRINDIKTEVQP